MLTRKRIMTAAREEFAQRGFEGGSTRSVAKRASIKHALLIYHYKSKVGLWRAVLTEIHETRRARTARLLADLEGCDDTTKLRAILAATVRVTATDPNFHWIMAHAAATPNAELEWHVSHYVRETLEYTGQLIRSAQRAGRFVAGDPMHLLQLFIGASTRLYLVRAVAERTLSRSPLDPDFIEEHIRTCFRLFFR